MSTISFDVGVAAQRPRRALHQVLLRAIAGLREWRQRARSRAELARFDDRMLRDIGVSRVDALYEINKPFWRI